MLATIVDSYISEREEFQLTRGYQPINSLFYLKEGSFYCNFEGKEYTATPGMVAIFNVETLMARHVLSPIKFLYIKFNIKNAGLFPIKSGVFPTDDKRLVEDLEMIEQLSSQRTQIGLELRNHYLNDLLLHLLLPSAPLNSQKANSISLPSSLDKPIAFLKQNLSSKISVEDVSLHCGMSPSSLENKFREVTGASIYNYLISLRMEEATRLLTETTYSVTEIATRCGYENLFYFCNAFKRQLGVTPTAFRKANLI